MTIRARLTIASAVIIAVVTSLLGLAVYQMVRFQADYRLALEMDRRINFTVNRIADSNSPPGSRPSRNPPPTVEDMPGKSDEERSRNLFELGIGATVVVDSDSLRPVNPDRRILDADALVRTLEDGKTRASMVRINQPGTSFFESARIETAILTWKGHKYVVQIGEPMRVHNDELGQLRDSLSILIPTSWLFAVLAALYLTQNALAPIKRLDNAAKDLLTGRPDKRLPVVGRDEMAHLAVTVNEGLDEIEKGYRRLEQFVADASHELKSPLTTVMLRSTPATQSSATPQEGAENLEAIRRAAIRMRKTVDDLLLVNKMDAGSESNIQLIDVSTCLGEVADEFTERFGERLESDIESGLMCCADETLIRRLAVNLLENAWKYGGPEALVHFTGEKGDSVIVIKVSDNGPGLDKGQVPHLFERFYRGDSARSHDEAGDGSGLGLSIVDAIARHHKGTVTVETDGGKGFTVAVTLPSAKS